MAGVPHTGTRALLPVSFVAGCGSSLEEMWTSPRFELISPAAIGADGSVLVFENDPFDFGAGRLHAYDPATGEERWVVDAIGGTPMIAPSGQVVMLGPNGIVAFTQDGEGLWPPDGFPSWLAYRGGAFDADGGIVLVREDGNVSAWTSDLGAVRWEASVFGNILAAPVIRGDGVVIVEGDTHVTALRDGDVVWRVELPDEVLVSPGVAGPDGSFYTPRLARFVAIDPDGAIAWEAAGGTVSPAVGPDGTLYVSNPAFTAYAPDGTVRWSASYECGPPAVGDNGHVYAACATLNLYDEPVLTMTAWNERGDVVFEEQHLDVIWDTRPTAPVMDDEGRLFFTFGQLVANVYAYAGASPLARGGSPRYGVDAGNTNRVAP